MKLHQQCKAYIDHDCTKPLKFLNSIQYYGKASFNKKSRDKFNKTQVYKIHFKQIVNSEAKWRHKKESKCKIICVGLKKELANEREMYTTINQPVIYIPRYDVSPQLATRNCKSI